jgi:hypothetical protein
MAKQRHNEPEPASSRNAMIALTAGGLAVAALVVWALMRTVQPPPASVEQPPIAEMPSATATAPAVVETAQTATSATTPPPPAPQGAQTDVARISAEDLREQYNSGAVTIIDVRDAAAFEAGHIPGSLNMPFSSIEGLADMIPKGKPIVTYCT